jgi:hypothetical protein
MRFIYCQSLNFLLKCLLDNVGTMAEKWKLHSLDFSKYWATKPCAKQIVSLGGFGKVITPYFFDGSDVNGYIEEFGTTRQKLVVIKTNRHKTQLFSKKQNGYWIVDVNYAESYFAPFVKYVNDLGVCPFLCNYMASYLTEKNRMVMFIERYDTELRTFELMNNQYLINILFQFVYTIFVLKSYLGMVHYDTHLRNLMLIKNEQNKYKYILLYDRYKNIGILLPFLEYTLKLIDFGLCTIDLRDSYDPKLKESGLRVKSINAPENVENLTIELQYLVLHLWQAGLPAETLACLSDFCAAFYDNVDLTPSKILANNPKLVLTEGKCIITSHDVGIANSIIQSRQNLIDGLLRYCITYGSVIQDSSNTVYSPFKIQELPSFNEIFVVHPQASKQYIPSSECKWFRPYFFQINKNRVGYNWMFPVHNYKPVPYKTLPRTGLCLKYKTQPFHFTNAYLSFINGNMRFHYAKNAADIAQSYVCGKFLMFNRKEIKIPKTTGQLFLSFKERTFIVIFMINPVEYTQIIAWAKKQKYEALIDATHHVSFLYEKEYFNNHFKPIMYIKF